MITRQDIKDAFSKCIYGLHDNYNDDEYFDKNIENWVKDHYGIGIYGMTAEQYIFIHGMIVEYLNQSRLCFSCNEVALDKHEGLFCQFCRINI